MDIKTLSTHTCTDEDIERDFASAEPGIMRYLKSATCIDDLSEV